MSNNNNQNQNSPISIIEDPYEAPKTPGGNGPFCCQCGKQITPRTRQCPFCHQYQFQGKQKSKFVAATFGILLGFFGAHRFYLGQWWGIFYIIFGVLGWLVAIIESLVFLFTPQESWQRKYSNVMPTSGGTIAAAVIGSVFFIGILAAIALPAYQDYTYRAKISEALNQINPIQSEMQRYVNENNRFASSIDELGIKANAKLAIIESISLKEQGIIKLQFSKNGTSVIAKETMLFVPTNNNGQLIWDCSGGTLPSKYRPPNCRDGQFSSQQFSSSTQPVSDRLGLIELRVPDNWSSRTDLNDDAIFQMANLRREEYMIVIDDTFSDVGDISLAEYASLQNDSLSNSGANLRLVSNSEIQVNGQTALQYQMQANVENNDIDYMIVYLEGKERYYFVMMWTLSSKKNKAWSVFNSVIRTFKEK